MPTLSPPSRPRLSASEAAIIIAQHEVKHPVVLIGLPGYYLDTMGRKGRNDRGMYDDAFALVTANGFHTFNGNCDPSVYREGIATLQAGVYDYRVGIHGLSKPKNQQYEALVQAGPVVVFRDGTERTKAGVMSDRYGYSLGNGLWTDARDYPNSKFAINIHRGGVNGTSSLGCQTVPPDQYAAWLALIKGELARAKVSIVKYILHTSESHA